MPIFLKQRFWPHIFQILKTLRAKRFLKAGFQNTKKQIFRILQDTVLKGKVKRLLKNKSENAYFVTRFCLPRHSKVCRLKGRTLTFVTWNPFNCCRADSMQIVISFTISFYISLQRVLVVSFDCLNKSHQ